MGKHTAIESYSPSERDAHQPPENLKGLYAELEDAYELAYRIHTPEARMRLGGRAPMEHINIAHETARDGAAWGRAAAHVAFLEERLAATASADTRRRGAHVMPRPEPENEGKPTETKPATDDTVRPLGFTL